MIDISSPESELWQLFRDRLRSLGICGCTCTSADICDFAAAATASYDVVHCSGVLYHHPNPVLLIESLRRVTEQYLVLTSAVLPPEVVNESGSFRLPSSGAVFIPALSPQERE